jgi:hypothetical protein
MWGVLAAGAADPTPPTMEKTPLPPGPWITQMPSFSMWRIVFSSTGDKPAGKPDAAEKPEASDKVSDATMLLPRSVLVTRTLPSYHVTMPDTAGRSSEVWCDGKSSYLQTPGHATPYVPGSNPDGSAAIPSYLDYGKIDFPDVEWVSAKTYLGSIKGESTSYLVFRNDEKGPTVYVDAAKHRPVRWQSASELRKFEYLEAPTEPLALPSAVTQVFRLFRRTDEMTSHRPPRGS